MKISVLMSIYNERESDIRESIGSILGQSESHFEFIIIVDNPERNEIASLISDYHDDRIKLFYNEKNIGLAMSMNYAASLASADIFARMDADDIAEFDRFERELAFLNNGYDLVFSNYILIDENSKVLDQHMPIYDNVGIERRISLDPSIIHHPTVMFTKAIFDKVGGYRNFPCSQDADLWLRMQEVGCKFNMLHDKLLRYRINPCSVSSKKWYQQQLTIHYIMHLSLERLQTGKDSFSEEDYYKYLSRKGYTNENKAVELRKCEDMLTKALEFRMKGNVLLSFLLRLFVFLKSKQLRDYYCCVLQKKRFL